MSELNRPKLPEKLPAQFRKKLSITFPDYDSDSSRNSCSKSNDENFYYKEPIEQPTLRKKVLRESKSVSYFNESIYEQFETKDLAELSDDVKSEENSYLSLENLESNTKKIDSNDTSVLSEIPFEDNNQELKPPLPPKRTKRKMGLSRVSLDKRESITSDESLKCISTSDSSDYGLEVFKKDIFKSQSNQLCADCKRSGIVPNWISCAYFITLCDMCAECHLKLYHTASRLYVIKIDLLYEYLKSNDKTLHQIDFISFFKILDQTGNEKINSLLEYNIDEIHLSLISKSQIEDFITLKYIKKRFINSNELDMTSNYLEELNKNLFQIISGQSISMTIYYLFLGANRNYFQNNQTVLDKSTEYQHLYLSINKALSFNQLSNECNHEFFGDAVLIFNLNEKSTVKKVSANLKLKNNDLILTQFDSNRVKSHKIGLDSIIKIKSFSDFIIELKWCSFDHCILSHFLEFTTQNEIQFWYKNILLKLVPSIRIRFSSFFDYCQVNSFGNLTLVNQYNLENREQKCFIILFETLLTQVEKYFKKFILLINRDDESKYEIIDVRKMNRIKLLNQVLVVESEGKIVKLKSDGYGENLKQWYESLTNFSNLEFRSLEEQLINKDNCVLLVEKCCSYIELHYLTETLFYPLNIKYSKKYLNIARKLERDRDFKIDRIKPEGVLNIMKIFFSKYVTKYHLTFLNLETLKSSSDTVFYSTLKRIILHLNFVQNYKILNKMTSEYLSNIFIRIIYGDEVTGKLDTLIDNCEDFYQLKPGFISFQYEIFDKLIKIKSKCFESNENYLITVYLFHKHSEQSFQLQVDTNFTCKDALLRCKEKFKLYESKYWCLFEVFDHEQHLAFNGFPQDKSTVLLERILPTNAKLIESISNWNSFNFVVKYNFIQIDFERFFITNESVQTNALSSMDKCVCMILCETCGVFRTSFRNTLNTCNPSHKKWKDSILLVRNANLKLFDMNGKSLESENFDSENSKVFYEDKIEDCIFYYGLYDPNSLSLSSVESNESTENLLSQNILINEEECLTFYDKKQKLIYLIQFENKEQALTRYCNFFKLCYYPDTWSLFKLDQMPVLKPKVPEMRRSIINQESKNSSS